MPQRPDSALLAALIDLIRRLGPRAGMDMVQQMRMESELRKEGAGKLVRLVLEGAGHAGATGCPTKESA